jgi:hypothetical protein
MYTVEYSAMHARGKGAVDEMSDEQFVALLRESVRRYLASVDAWEAQYRKHYRVRSPGKPSADLEALHQGYLKARGDLEPCVPRARRTCRQLGLKEPWQAMLHISLGSETPQTGPTTAIGRAERALISECLAALEAAAAPPLAPREPAPKRSGIFQRLYDFFF